jgi:hypothetical protein
MNCAFAGQSPDKIVPQIEEKLRKELGLAAPVAYQVEDRGAEKGVGAVLKNVVGNLFGAKEDLLFTAHFQSAQPRAFELDVHVARQGVGAHAGTLLYSTKIAKPVAAEASLEDPKTFGKSKFTGDAAACEKLNAKGDLLKAASNLARTSGEVGGLRITIERLCKILPAGGASLLVVQTIPRMTSMGFSCSLDAKDFCDLAVLVEAAL